MEAEFARLRTFRPGLVRAMAVARASAPDGPGPGGEMRTTPQPAKSNSRTPKSPNVKRRAIHRRPVLWHTSSDSLNSRHRGATKTNLRSLGMDVVAQTAKPSSTPPNRDDVETIPRAKNPAPILARQLNPVTSAQPFKPAIAAGVKLVLLSNKAEVLQCGQRLFPNRHRPLSFSASTRRRLRSQRSWARMVRLLPSFTMRLLLTKSTRQSFKTRSKRIIPTSNRSPNNAITRTRPQPTYIAAGAAC